MICCSLSLWERVGVREVRCPSTQYPHPNPLPQGEGVLAGAMAAR
jgi:hypothetical protein